MSRNVMTLVVACVVAPAVAFTVTIGMIEWWERRRLRKITADIDSEYEKLVKTHGRGRGLRRT